MNNAEYQQALETALALLERAEADEALAREREQKGYDPAEVMHCGFEWGGIDCYTCETMPECDLLLREYEDQTKAIFNTAWTGYQEALATLRNLVAAHDAPIVWRLLARTLMNIDVHPNNMDKSPADLYWEAQYWYLRLYYEAGVEDAFEKAKYCEAFRHATVRLIEE